MKIYLAVILLFVFPLVGLCQTIKLRGTMFDPGGALVVKGQIKAIDEKGQSTVGTSNSEGDFEISLTPGIYALEVSGSGFLTVKLNEFLVVNSSSGKMTMDFVLFGSKYHEPCGYSGADCLPAKSLIREYEIKYSPKLKDIRDEFAPLPKATEKNRVNEKN